MLQIIKRWLGDVLVVEKGFGVLNVAIFRLVDVVLLADVIIPIDAFGQEAMGPVMVFGDGAQDGQAVELAIFAMDPGQNQSELCLEFRQNFPAVVSR